MKRNSISEALRIARKRYALGGADYGLDAYNQLLEDIAKQKAKPLPQITPLTDRGPKSDLTPPVGQGLPAVNVADLGSASTSDATPILPKPIEGGGGGGFTGSYGLPSTTPEGIMSSTSTGPAMPSSATPGFSFTGAPIGKVDAYDLPPPEAPTPIGTKSVSTTSVAPVPGQFGNMYTGKAGISNQAAANQAALGTQIGTQVGNALNTIGATPASSTSKAAVGMAPQPAASPYGSLIAPQSYAPVFDIMGNVAMPGSKGQIGAPAAPSGSRGTVPGVQQPSKAAPTPFATPEQLEDNPDLTGPTPAGAAFQAANTAGNIMDAGPGPTGGGADTASSDGVGGQGAGTPGSSSGPAGSSQETEGVGAGAPSSSGANIGSSAPAMGISIMDPANMSQAMIDALNAAKAEEPDEADDTADEGDDSSDDGSDGDGGDGDGGDGDGGWGGDDGGGWGGDGGDGGDGGGGDGGGGDGGGGDGGGGGGDGGGGGEKRGGFVDKKPSKMVNKALKVSGDHLYKMRHHKDWSEHKGFAKTGGKLSHMSPGEFLRKSKPLNMDHDDERVIHHFKKKMERAHKLDPLALYKDGGQDGRHRAHAAKQLGIKKVPVIVWPGKARGGSIVDRALVLTSKPAKRQRGRP